MSIRLIDTTTLRMKVFVGDRIPKYAILSHTWVDDEEVDFQEMTSIIRNYDHPATRKSGYAKIYTTCEKARRHHINYAWVDTCCIDKSSSAELSEAINSMFKWYRDAEVCYVFLSDLPPGLAGYKDIGAAMEKCRWFERGWTLQELIAPEDLRFYDSAWHFLGRKDEMRSTIADITHIDQAVLEDSHILPDIPVASRMHWAAKRVTTRAEDIAYCLLGIFDVNMPLLYGEGQKAFIRLQEEIMKHSNDLSIFWHSPEMPTYTDRKAAQAALFPDLPVDTKWAHSQQINMDQGGASQKVQYRSRDLFAKSPDAFYDSAGLTCDLTFASSTRDFSLTNNGLHFGKAKLHVVLGRGFVIDSDCYVMPLDHSDGDQECYLALQKVGPGLFVKRAILKDRSGLRTHYFRMETEDAYIVSQTSPLIEKQMRNCRHHAIRFDIEGARNRAETIFESVITYPSPRENWDLVHQEFLTMGELFEGYMVLRPYFADFETNMWKSNEEAPYCYLACLFAPFDGRESEPEEPDLWVKLLTPGDFEKHHFRLAKGEGVARIFRNAVSMPGARDRLYFDDLVVKASIKVAAEYAYPAYQVDIRFHRNSKSRQRVAHGSRSKS
ncbi:hypothetical protein H2200_000106 [Cladophialophora chaetospira]|uniref:Heterokaryon incompatibility domain-containing protein n=1 Tax=Cladophialophora chaetospira TaxID=386627 RepID=A0AA39CQM2_9EURO|nr:hypothetical protein H2200_000106 [Cladophialophora chaetospira]